MKFVTLVIFAVLRNSWTFARTLGVQDKVTDITVPRESDSVDGFTQDIAENDDDVDSDIKLEHSPEDYFIGFLVRTIAKKVVENEVDKLEDSIRSDIEDTIDSKIKELGTNSDEPQYTNDYGDAELTGDATADDVEDDDTVVKREDGSDNGRVNFRNTIRRHFFPFFLPTVTVTVVDAKARNSNHSIRVPLSADMTVLESLIAAARMHIEQYDRGVQIPYNVIIDWSMRLNCFTIVKALGTNNRRRSQWTLTVKDHDNNVMYKGRCLPEDNLILRPLWAVTITYEHVKKHRANRQRL